MTDPRGPDVVDTDVYSARLTPGASFAQRYDALLVDRPAFLSFQTVAELRYGALLSGWAANACSAWKPGSLAPIVHTGSELVRVYAELRVAWARTGHALGQRDHDADRWIAATALRLRVPLVSNDRIFVGTPGLVLGSVRT